MHPIDPLAEFLRPFILRVMERAEKGQSTPDGPHERRLLLHPGYAMLAPFLAEEQCKFLADDIETSLVYAPEEGEYRRMVGCHCQVETLEEIRWRNGFKAVHVAERVAQAWIAAIVAVSTDPTPNTKTRWYPSGSLRASLLPSGRTADLAFEGPLLADHIRPEPCRRVLKEIRDAQIDCGPIPSQLVEALAARGVQLT